MRYIPPVSPPAPPRIAVVRLSSMGDILLTTPLLRALRESHPRAWITFITKTGFAPLLEHNPRLSEVLRYLPGSPLRDLGRAVRERRFTHCLDLHGSIRSRVLRWLAPGSWRGYPKHRLARALLIRAKRDRYRDRRPVAERYFDAARGLGVQPDERGLEFFLSRAAVDAARRLLSEAGVGSGRALVAVVPGAAHATKRWPGAHWRALTGALVSAGYDVAVVGGPAEAALGEEVAAPGAGRAVNAAGRLDVTGTAALLKEARCVVAGDTGAMHLATAVGTPVVALFGPTVEQFGFFPYHARASVIQRDLPCRPCSAMGGPRCPLGHHACLEGITPDLVFDAVRRLPR
jgi:heptosyltransferase-2